MVKSHSRFVTTSLHSGNLLVAETSSIPQDLYLISGGDLGKAFSQPVTTELNAEKVLRHKISVSPDLEFQIERFVVSQTGLIAAIGRRCLAILQPVGDTHVTRDLDVNTFMFRCFPVCRYVFHPKSSIELVHVSFASAENELLSVLTSDSNIRLFDMTNLSSESLLAPLRTVNLVYHQRSSANRISANLVSSSRISLAKGEPFVSVAFLPHASVITSLETSPSRHIDDDNHMDVTSFLPFMVLRSNGDVYFGFVDISNRTSENGGSEKGGYNCQLSGPLKVLLPDGDTADDGASFCDLNACSLHVVTGDNFAKGYPLVLIASANGSIGHYLLINEPEASEHSFSCVLSPQGNMDPKSNLTLHFPPCGLYGVERIRLACSSHPTSASSLTSWLNDPSCLKLYTYQHDGAFSYVATASSTVFRVCLPWLQASATVADSAFISKISDDPTFAESLLSVGTQATECITVGHVPSCNAIVVSIGSTLYAIPTCVNKTATANQNQLPVVFDEQPPLFVSPTPIELTEPEAKDVLPPTEDFVAVIQRALARQANLNPKLLSNNLGISKDDDQLNKIYTAATGAVALLQQEYFGRTDVAARQLLRLEATCDARKSHVAANIETRLRNSCADFGNEVIPALANKMDKVADRLATLVNRLSKLSGQARGGKSGKSRVLEDACLADGFADQLNDVETNLAQINTLFLEVDEKASYLSSQISSFADRSTSTATSDNGHDITPSNLMPLFDSLGSDIRRITEDLRRIKGDVERVDSIHARFG